MIKAYVLVCIAVAAAFPAMPFASEAGTAEITFYVH